MVAGSRRWRTSSPRDNRFRLAAFSGEPGPRALPARSGRREPCGLSGLSLLQIQDSTGRILSSGHFRNEYDRLEPELPRLSASRPAAPRHWCGPAPPNRRWSRWPRRSGSRWPAGRSCWSAGSRPRIGFSGGSLRTPTSRGAATPIPAGGRRTGTRRSVALALPFLDAPGATRPPTGAPGSLTRSSGTLAALRRGLNTWFLVSLCGHRAAGGGARRLAVRARQPPAHRAGRKTAAIDLDRLDQDFATDRDGRDRRALPAARRMTDAAPRRRGPAPRGRAPRRDGRPGAAGESRHQERPGADPERAPAPGRGRARRPGGAARGVRGAAGTLESSLDLSRHPGPQLRPALARGLARGRAT